MKRNSKGLGSVYQPKFKDRKTGEVRTSPTWWVSYSHRGTKYRLSSNSAKRGVALKLLKRKLAEIGSGRPVIPDAERTTFEDLAAILVNDYKANGRRSLRLLPGKLQNLREFFGMGRAIDISSDRVTAYVAQRLEQGAANATVNYELSLLKRAFRLAHKAGRVASRPEIDMLHVSNTRKGFFEEDQFRAVLRHLPDDLKPVVQTAYLTGWRIDSEILTRKRSHLDLKAGWLRLEPGEAKNQQGRMFPLTPELREVLEAQVSRTRDFERETGSIVPWLFHRLGKPIKSFRRSWLTALKLAGVPGRLRHDFRRTAVRNLERAGVSRSAAMAMVGHRTQAIYSRYAIVNETDLKEAADKLAQMSTRISQSMVKAGTLPVEPRMKESMQ
jgi:integrase